MATIRGGKKLGPLLNKIAVSASGATKVKIGFMANATYPDGKSVALIAAIQEFGAPSRNIPPRPFFRTMVQEKSPEWPSAIRSLLKANDYDAKKTLEMTGLAIQGQLQQSIRDWTTPPNAPSTIARKGFNKPLIDTSHMLNSVTYVVE